ncbi:DNA-protecting protein DprA [Altererythrobacter xixiisoli]|uniref:DNA-protecting protein DprA n=1 Tax=Croceibacterium xixiisoli TaxID=1476466 RepID=A0A6I4TW07_9SPHN|nr:DNA-processing protein DprA [Croceibacterium xixiisoli]MXO98778.1 DNA-protecting protein DprA [Croceibacterium xixiisoli]
MTKSGQVLSQDEAFARIRLIRSPNIGPVSYRQLLNRFGTARAALAALPDLAAQGGKRRYSLAPADRIEREVGAVRAAGARYLFQDSSDYPALLAQLDSAPPVLTCRGNLALASQPCVAIVGARNASAAAVRLARDFAAGLAEQGYTVVSGLARGIDGAAHAAALSSTIGVIASGIDIAYPPQHSDLQERIAREALLLAEQPPGTEPRGSHFPSRNRIIAGLSLGTLVVEAAPRSGSLITARLAGEAGREVMAIPGSPLEPRSRGCNQLIREGAVLVQDVDDVVELLSGFDGTPRIVLRPAERRSTTSDLFAPAPTEAPIEEGDDSRDILSLLTQAPISVDELVRQSGAGAGAVQMALLELEIAGRLVRHAGGRVSLQA